MVPRVQGEDQIFPVLAVQRQQARAVFVLIAVAFGHGRVSLHEAESCQVLRSDAPALQETAGAVQVSFFHIELMSF